MGLAIHGEKIRRGAGVDQSRGIVAARMTRSGIGGRAIELLQGLLAAGMANRIEPGK